MENKFPTSISITDVSESGTLVVCINLILRCVIQVSLKNNNILPENKYADIATKIYQKTLNKVHR